MLVGWLVVAVGLGFFAPRVETALSGAGWETTGSQSVQARHLIDKNFQGLSSYALMTVIYSPTQTSPAPRSGRRSRTSSARCARQRGPTVVAPAPGVSISRDGHTAIVQAGAAKSSNGMVAADGLKGSSPACPPRRAGAPDRRVGDVVRLQRREPLGDAEVRGDLLAGDVRDPAARFGSLVAAGLPLMLTMIGLASAAGLLYLGTLLMPISIWAMNFALMFALALGIDYALFIVHRFRGAFFGHHLSPVDATAVTMDTAGKAVLFSGITVLISLTAVMLVPSPAFRSMSLGIMLAVIFVLAATFTLLPAVLAKLGPRVDKLALPWAHSGEHRSARFAAWGERLWRQPVRYGVVALALLVGLAIPVTQLKTSMPSIKVVPTSDSSRIGYHQVQHAFGPGATGPLQIVTPAARPQRRRRSRRAIPASPADANADQQRVRPAHRDPQAGPSNPAVGQTIDRLRSALPAGSLIGGAVAENHDLQAALSAKTPLVIGVVMALGFLLLLIALQAPLLAAVGVLTNLLATGAAFGVAKWIFQDGALHSLLGFQPQGFLDAWGPVFFFAMIFAISMDYTVFLLSAAKEHWDRTHDPGGDGRRPRPLRPGDLRRGRGDGRGVLHLRPLRPAPAEGDGHDPRRRRAPRRGPDPAAADAGAAAADGTLRLVPAALGAPGPTQRHLRPLMSKAATDDNNLNRALADRMVPGIAPRPPTADRTRPVIPRTPGPGGARAAHRARQRHGRRSIPVLIARGEIVAGEQAILTYLATTSRSRPSADSAPRRERKAQGTGASMSQVDTGYTLSTTPRWPSPRRWPGSARSSRRGIRRAVRDRRAGDPEAEARRRARALPDPRRLQPQAGPRRAASRARARRPASLQRRRLPATRPDPHRGRRRRADALDRRQRRARGGRHRGAPATGLGRRTSRPELSRQHGI